MINLHIDRGESTVGDGATDSTSQGESGVKVEASRVLLGGSSGLRSGSGGGRHYGGFILGMNINKQKERSAKKASFWYI